MRPTLPAVTASRGYAQGGVAPSLLLDVQTPAGTNFFWSDRNLKGIPSVITGAAANYQAWLLGAGTLNFYPSLQTDTFTLTLQNLSGDVLQSDFERITAKSTLEGSLFVFRYYQVDLGWPWIEMHGTLSVGSTNRQTVTLNGSDIFGGQDDTPEQQTSESCQLIWGETRCGAQGTQECLYTRSSCQVPEHFVGIDTSFETGMEQSTAAVLTQQINRRRSW
jgi:hypothetical protein